MKKQSSKKKEDTKSKHTRKKKTSTRKVTRKKVVPEKIENTPPESTTVATDQIQTQPEKEPEKTMEAGEKIDVSQNLNQVQVEKPVEAIEKEPVKILIPFNSTVKEVSELTGINPQEIIKTALIKFKKPVSLNQKLESEFIELLLLEFGFEAVIKMPYEITSKGEKTIERQPVVTVMGHVDHGKTTLLDSIRKTNVAAKEYGGITQKIGAYEVEWSGKKITFIDTPGHEAFTAMRARGANVTDIVILVVSAEDGVMPQTVEALYHARSADVPIIVAINKIDSPRANPDKVKNQLSEYEVVPLEWGGKNIFVEVSAKTGKNIDKLLDAILFQAELAQLKAYTDVPGRGVVLEAHKDPKRGVVATLILKDGILKNSDIIWAGNTYGKLKAMFDFTGKKINETHPGKPVEVLGLEDVPEAGSYFLVQTTIENAIQLAKEFARISKKTITGNIMDMLKEKKEKINVILKCDYSGSLEAIENMLSSYDLNILAKGVGNITNADALLASASKAIIIGFNTYIEDKAVEALKKEGINYRVFKSVYEVSEYVKDLIEGRKEKVEVEKKIGSLRIIRKFNLKAGVVAGCRVDSGYIRKGARVKINRPDGIKEGTITSLKIFKEDVNEVKQGFECGVMFDFDDFSENEVANVYEVEKK